MDLARYCVNAVLVEGRSVRAVAAATGRSKSWVHQVLRARRRFLVNLTQRPEVLLLPEYREVISLGQHCVSVGDKGLVASCDRRDQLGLGQSSPAK